LSGLRDLCPLCAAGIAECDHEILRWSLVACEYEPCALADDAIAMQTVLEEVLRRAWRERRRPVWAGLHDLYAAGLEMLELNGEPCDEFDDLDPGFVESVIEAIAGMSGVSSSTEGDSYNEPDTIVLWATDVVAVREAIRSYRGQLEVELARD